MGEIKLYRSEEYLSKAIERYRDEDVPPIFVPTYNRPNPKILERLKKEPDLQIVLCIRREQYDMYKHWEGRVGFLLLDNVTDIGETRKRIIEMVGDYYEHFFMFDDDITELHFLVPSITRGGKEAMRSGYLHYGMDFRWKDILKLWMYYLSVASDKVVLSAPAFRPDSWFMKHAWAPLEYNKGECIQAICLNIPRMRQLGLDYRNTRDVGSEDYVLQFEIMVNGGYSLKLNDLMYGSTGNMTSGGSEGALGSHSLEEKARMYLERSMNFYGDHPGIKYTKSRRTKIDSVKFNWRYWRKQLK